VIHLMMRKMTSKIAFVAVLIFLSSQAWAQTSGIGIGSDEPMAAPPMVGIGGDSVAFTSEMERSNFLRGGINVQAGYNDNILNSAPTEGDMNYTILPSIAFDMSRSRLRWDLSYSPGFTLYQKFSSEDQFQHTFSTSFQYRMTPHVSLALDDQLSKTPSFSGAFQPGTDINGTNTVQTPTVLVAAPLISTLTNNDSGQITYQFSPNGMLGFGGNSSELYFLGTGPIPSGLSNSTAVGGQGFFTRRFGLKNELSVTYGFEKLSAQSLGLETQVHSITASYSLHLTQRMSLSLFGGAQHAESQGDGLPTLISWNPTAGGAFHAQGTHNSFVLQVSKSISNGGGLQGAVSAYGVNADYRHQFTERLSGNLSAFYSNNNVLQPVGLPSSNGHIVFFTGSLDRSLSEHLSAEIAYSRVTQQYSGIPSVGGAPNTDRGWVTISYQFQRPLGR
jgi:hypothetical protein